MALTSTTNTFPGKKRGDYINKNAIQRNEEVVYIEPTLVAPINFHYAIPVIITDQANKYINGKAIVIKALATSPANTILGFTKIADRDPELFFEAGEDATIFKGADVYNEFYALVTVGETIVAGDLGEFVPATNTYSKVTTGVALVEFREAGSGGDILVVRPLI